MPLQDLPQTPFFQLGSQALTLTYLPSGNREAVPCSPLAVQLLISWALFDNHGWEPGENVEILIFTRGSGSEKVGLTCLE